MDQSPTCLRNVLRQPILLPVPTTVVQMLIIQTVMSLLLVLELTDSLLGPPGAQQHCRTALVNRQTVVILMKVDVPLLTCSLSLLLICHNPTPLLRLIPVRYPGLSIVLYDCKVLASYPGRLLLPFFCHKDYSKIVDDFQEVLER